MNSTAEFLIFQIEGNVDGVRVIPKMEITKIIKLTIYRGFLCN